MGDLIDMEGKGYELIACWTHFSTLTLTHDLLDIQGHILKWPCFRNV